MEFKKSVSKPTFYIGESPNDESIVRFTSIAKSSSSASQVAPASSSVTVFSVKKQHSVYDSVRAF
jgi:hypothetical protein